MSKIERSIDTQHLDGATGRMGFSLMRWKVSGRTELRKGVGEYQEDILGLQYLLGIEVESQVGS